MSCFLCFSSGILHCPQTLLAAKPSAFKFLSSIPVTQVFLPLLFGVVPALFIAHAQRLAPLLRSYSLLWSSPTSQPSPSLPAGHLCGPRAPKDRRHPQLALSLASPASLRRDALGTHQCGCWDGQTGLTSLAKEVALALSAVRDKHSESNVPLLWGQTTAFGSLGVMGRSCPPPHVNTGPQTKTYSSKEPGCPCVRDQEMSLWSTQVTPSG